MTERGNPSNPTGVDLVSYSARCPTTLDKPISNTALDIVAAAVQVATAPKDSLFTGIRLIRATVAGRFAEQLREEWAKLV